MRHGTPDGNDTARLHPVATDQPGLVLHRPLQKLRQIAVVYALLPLLCAALGGFVAVKIGEANTDRRLGTLERDLADRRAANQKSNAERDRQIAELRRLVCTFADHAQPRDDQVEQVRATYGCTGGPYPEPTTSPAPRLPSPGVSRPTAGAFRPPGVTATTTRPGLAPTRSLPPSTRPPVGGGVVCVVVPPLPPVCL